MSACTELWLNRLLLDEQQFCYGLHDLRITWRAINLRYSDKNFNCATAKCLAAARFLVAAVANSTDKFDIGHPQTLQERTDDFHFLFDNLIKFSVIVARFL